MAVTHYDVFTDADETEIAWCGTKVGESYEYSSNWDYVSCKKCIKSKDKINAELEQIRKSRAEAEDGFVDFMFEPRYNCGCGFVGCMDELNFESEPETYDAIWKCPNCNTILDRQS
jgi:hypothetical protein